MGEVLPTGTVTLLLADVEGSTRLWEHQSQKMTAAVDRLDEAVSQIVSAHEGVRPLEQGEGDSFVAAFARASDAITCALELQRAPLAPIRLRIGLHTGEVQLRGEGNYIGPTINRTARIRDLAHGGQTVLSGITGDLVVDRLPPGVWLTDLGTHLLRDLPRPERVVQLCHPDLHNDFPPLRINRPAGSQRLPTHLTSFVGRETDLREAARILENTRLLTLTGAGGVGKTRLAVQIASGMLSAQDDNVWFVDLAPLTDDGAVPVAVARVLGLPDQPGRSTDDTVLQFLRARQAMVVLDNCEHLLDASAAFAADVLADCPGITVLATSREPLGIAGEAIWRVGPLSLTGEAVELFVDRACQVQPEFSIGDEQDAAAVAEICRRLDGMPLAIELAAARVRVLSLTEIVDSLHDRFRLLTGGARTAVRRQQTLRASVDWSYALLSAPERILLRRLAVFMGGFDLRAAQVIAGDDEAMASHQVLDMLTLLVDKSLVTAETTAGRMRYRLLETVRQYAQEKLGESGEADGLRTRHREHYSAVAARLDAPGRVRLDTLIADTEIEFDNLQAAFTWSRENAEANPALDLASSLTPLWSMRGRFQQGLGWFEAVLGDDTLNGTIEPAVLTRALADRAFLGGLFGVPDAMEDAERAVALARGLDDPALLVRALASCSTVAVYDADTAPPLLTETIDRARALGDDWRLSQALAWRALEAIATGQPTQVRTHAEEGLRLADAIGDGFIARQCRTWLAVAGWYRGDLAGAVAEFRAVVAEGQAAHDGIAQVIALVGLGFALSCCCESAAARAAAEAGLEVSASLGGFDGDVAYAALARAAISAGDVATAVSASEEAWRVRVVRRETLVLSWTPLALAALAQGDLVVARQRADELVSSTTGWHLMVAHAQRARVAIALGEHDRAERDAHDALAIGTDIGSVLVAADALECLATLAAACEAHRQAARLFGAAQAIRDRNGIARYQIYQSDHDSALDEVRNTLGDNDFGTAWAEGAALSTEAAIAYAQRGRGQRKRPSSGWAALTPAEHDVVRLVSQGLTNNDIAAQLFVSPRTVQTHLTHIYTKLNLTSRVQLVQEAGRHA
ncbi:transcriptional regulator [Mycobacterium sp. 852002-51163_SCH5372311]|nr:transcriptional regulator [Mycobacterium sp. 852002-51163_SCH5372311]